MARLTREGKTAQATSAIKYVLIAVVIATFSTVVYRSLSQNHHHFTRAVIDCESAFEMHLRADSVDPEFCTHGDLKCRIIKRPYSKEGPQRQVVLYHAANCLVRNGNKNEWHATIGVTDIGDGRLKTYIEPFSITTVAGFSRYSEWIASIGDKRYDYDDLLRYVDSAND